MSLAFGDLGDQWPRHQLHRDHRLPPRFRLLNRRHSRIAPLLPVGQPDGRANLGRGQVLKSVEMLLGLVLVAGALQGRGHHKLRRGVQRVDLQRLPQNADSLLVLLHFEVAIALKIVRIHVHGIGLGRPLKAGQRRLQFVARMLGKAQHVPRLRAVLVESQGLLKIPLRLIQLLQIEQRNALVDGRLRQPWIPLERFGKALGRLLGKLLAHLRHAAIVGPHRLGVKARLRSRRGRNCHKKNKGQGPGNPHRISFPTRP